MRLWSSWGAPAAAAGKGLNLNPGVVSTHLSKRLGPGVEHMMGFCTQEEHEEFMRTCPQFERDLLRSGIILVKYWLSVSDDEQERRFKARLKDPAKQWKLSGMDLEARRR